MTIEDGSDTCQPDVGMFTKTGSWLKQHPFVQVSLGLTFVGATVFLRYRSFIRRRLRQMEERLEKGLIYRDTSLSTTSKQRFRCLELDPSLVHKDCHGESCRMMSMGEYLSQLRVIEDKDDKVNKEMPDVLKREFQAFLGTYLLSTMGPRIGPAVLPMLGISKVDSWITSFAGKIASWIAAHIVMGKIQDSEKSATDYDIAGTIPFTIGEIVNITNINQKMTSYGSEDEVTALEKMRQGETTYSIKFDPGAAASTEETKGTAEEKETFTGDDNQEELVPSPFIVEVHMEQAIAKMEAKIQSSEDEDYDPQDKSFPPPTPLNERLLPDLHVGWGEAVCSHTKREIMLNRLISVLLNKLSYNYYLVESGAPIESLFVVQVGDKECQFPDEFIQELVDSNHSIEVCPRSTVTTFGFGVCIKEKDNTFTNIPLGLFLRTGLEGQNGDPLFFSAKHGGMDLSIRGPLIDKIVQRKEQAPAKCDVQFYVSLDGMCCWNSNHAPVVPWKDPVATSPIYTQEEALAAVRTTGLVAVTFNAIATEMKLPFGGYGILGVCNDSAALVDMAIRKETNLYPLISTERFLWHTLRRLVRLQNNLHQAETKTTHNLKPALEDIQNLIGAASIMESDIHSNPSKLMSAKHRYDVSYPTSIFQLTSKTKQMLQNESDQYEQYITQK